MDKISLNKLLKLTKSIILDEWEQDYLETSSIFNLCATEYDKECENMISNAIELEKHNLLEDVVYIYYCAVNNCSNLTKEKKIMESALNSFDKNLSKHIVDEKQTKIIFDMFDNIQKFITKINSYTINFEDYEKVDHLVEKFYLYFFLYVGNNLNQFKTLSQYSFHKEDFDFKGNDKFMVDFTTEFMSKNIQNVTEYVDKYIAHYNIKINSNIEKKPSIKNVITIKDKPTTEPIVTKEQNSQSFYYKDLAKDINDKIVGQEKAITQITNRLKSIEYGITKKQGAKAVYMLLGPTGVGKTETVKIINDLLREDSPLIRIDMSEYKLEHMSTKILGAPPSYVGHDENQNVLQTIKNNPNSFILIDEIEKAHPNIVDIFLHMFDEGKAKNSRGETVDLSDKIFFITSNIGAKEVTKNSIGFGERKESKEKTYNTSLESNFKPEFINRIDEVIVFNNMTLENTYEIINLLISSIERQFKEEKDIDIKINLTEEMYKLIINKTNYEKYGARDIRRNIEKHLTNHIVDYIVENGYGNYNLEFDLNKDGEIKLTNIESIKLLKK